MTRYGYQRPEPSPLGWFGLGALTGRSREDRSGYGVPLGETLIIAGWALFWLCALAWFAAGQVPSGSSASQYSSLDHLLMFGTAVPAPLLGLIGMGVSAARYRGVGLLRLVAELLSGLLLVSFSIALCFLIGIELAVAKP